MYIQVSVRQLAGQSSTLGAMFDWCRCLWGCALIRIVIPSPPPPPLLLYMYLLCCTEMCIISICVYGWALYEWYSTIMESSHSEIPPLAWKRQYCMKTHACTVLFTQIMNIAANHNCEHPLASFPGHSQFFNVARYNMRGPWYQMPHEA